MSNYAFVRNYVVKAESAVEASLSSGPSGPNGSKIKSAPVNLPGMVAPAQDPIEAQKERERKVVLERLLVAGGVAHLGAGGYEKAALAFTGVGSEALVSGPAHVRLLSFRPFFLISMSPVPFASPGSFLSALTPAFPPPRTNPLFPAQFIPPSDIALYAVLTSLATFNRAQLRTRVLENPNLRQFLDLEPYLREIVRAFYDSQFRTGLELLKKHEVRFFKPSLLSRSFRFPGRKQELMCKGMPTTHRLASSLTSTSPLTSTPSTASSPPAPSSPTSPPSPPSPSPACPPPSATPKHTSSLPL